MRNMFILLGGLCLLQMVSLVPAQLITLRDGKVGVNFAGYHADAGLGGLLTGNSAHGGLSASAGTPWGSRAAAGLGGNLDGRTSGVGYAAAQANPSVGASALLGGSVGEHGYIGAEAHSPGKTLISSSQHTVQPAPASPTSAPAQGPGVPTIRSYIQKVKPPKKYSLISQDPDRSEIIENHVKTAADSDAVGQHEPQSLIIVKRPRLRVKRPRQRQRTVYVMHQHQQLQQQLIPETEEVEVAEGDAEARQEQSPVEAPVKSEAKAVQTTKYKAVQRAQPVNQHFIAPQTQGPVGLALDIPIGILRSLQQSLGALTGGAPQQPQTVSSAGYKG
ncbi:uncharacterized protein Dana_GF11851, isoform A [Drosophila ananassae]|uniref:Uncharacterized protein, isoform A n=1 Tax=Drosophila ananassae TaxID=7217 RepID=B3MF08_DROAN|nr:uncharacterized protein LOC6494713 isoform X1 [Drosophila ananassae]EDV36629.2 uncharacterized protein Dana_GF11851, isoform A [Drosophila ananassae]